MTVTLVPAAGVVPKAREWARVDLPEGKAVRFGCPFCAATGIIPPGNVTADGAVIALVSCSSGSCDFSFQVFLEDWRRGLTVVPPAMCQADV